MRLGFVPFLFFYFKVSMESQETTNIVWRGPVYPSASFPNGYNLIIEQYQNQEFNIGLVWMYNPISVFSVFISV